MKIRTKERPEVQGQEFVRKTITLPVPVADFGATRAAQPAHGNNFSGYVRSLILRDKEELEKVPQPRAA